MMVTLKTLLPPSLSLSFSISLSSNSFYSTQLNSTQAYFIMYNCSQTKYSLYRHHFKSNVPTFEFSYRKSCVSVFVCFLCMSMCIFIVWTLFAHIKQIYPNKNLRWWKMQDSCKIKLETRARLRVICFANIECCISVLCKIELIRLLSKREGGGGR